MAMRVDWKISEDFDLFGVELKRYKRFLENNKRFLENKGCSQTTIENCSGVQEDTSPFFKHLRRQTRILSGSEITYSMNIWVVAQ
jgi:hypothetical protein